MLRRCAKWIPHPDSLALHHSPLSAPGRLATTVLVASVGGRHTFSAGTVTTHWLLALSTDWVPLVPEPTQKVAPATCAALTLFISDTVCPWLERTVLV